MAVLSIRGLPEEVHAALRMRAALAGRSMEAEARAILTQACREHLPKQPVSSLQHLVDELYGDEPPKLVVDDLLAERRREAAAE